eukprot:CAMPEP_0204897596 /NCGR_PEP_ID=MMETSP1397-20131031/828_1 /ASSEMBLY_ACC=CAM_ASM_000891 /TAXON_ID=49980 /ORGANISM="Climacostomum Climacostomum virens, Strain Stock W-24" /LENGTH=143 /DNA_ID=CAMNT_0052065367 /DNA_START=819 /DNA_END=1247 /DNA_ORIENTATION=+
MVKKNLISPSQVYGIVDKCWKGRKSLYLIHWKGHPEFHSTWEPSARLDLLKDLVQGFENKYKTASTRFNSAKSTLTTFTTPGSTLANSPIQKKKLDFENVTNSEKKLSPSALIVWKALDKTPPKPSIRGVRRQRKKLEFSAKK